MYMEICWLLPSAYSYGQTKIISYITFDVYDIVYTHICMYDA